MKYDPFLVSIIFWVIENQNIQYTVYNLLDILGCSHSQDSSGIFKVYLGIPGHLKKRIYVNNPATSFRIRNDVSPRSSDAMSPRGANKGAVSMAPSVPNGGWGNEPIWYWDYRTPENERMTECTLKKWCLEDDIYLPLKNNAPQF